MAITATKGSKTVRLFRAEEDRKNAQEKHWELAGSKLGNILGIKAKPEEPAPDDGTGYRWECLVGPVNIPSRESQQFATHLKDTEAVSDFALEKSLRQQREYLPVFAVRQKMMSVIRENNVVVIVGETGSGKTTQLTQYLLEEGYAREGSIIGCEWIE